MKICFKERVLTVVRGITPGHVMTYQHVAQRAGSSRAARAVGTIMRGNHDESVPCHRVIRSDGTLGGYNGGGTEKKKELLKREGYYSHV
ncbi:MAG: MGMT family protein [Patescibacteria group bacterium]